MSTSSASKLRDLFRIRRSGPLAALLLGFLPAVLVAALLANAAQNAGSVEAPTASLELEVTGIDEMRGSIVVAVFDSEQTFDERIDPVAQARLPIEAGAVSWSTELEAPATYAVIVYQDLNENGEIDMRRFGPPREPYGFSNNVRGRFAPPGFDEARFLLEPEGRLISIEID